MPQPKDWLDKLFTRTTPNDKELQAHYGWQQGDTAYEWHGNGMLKSVRTPEGATIRFEYDALGRRTLKETHDTCHRYAWDGNVLLHEWSYDRREKPRMEKDDLGRIRYDRPEPYSNLITWVYDGGSYTPVAKLTEEDSYTLFRTIWVRLYRLLTARKMWSGTAYLTYMAMCWNSEGKGTLYLLDSKDSMKMRRRDCITIASATMTQIQEAILVKTRLD